MTKGSLIALYFQTIERWLATIVAREMLPLSITTHPANQAPLWLSWFGTKIGWLAQLLPSFPTVLTPVQPAVVADCQDELGLAR